MSASSCNDGDHEANQEQQQQPQRILSIQSHVVSGYVLLLAVGLAGLHVKFPSHSSHSVLPADVGNKAAVFPLQLLGFDVDTIHTVQFSNHTGYPHGWTGERLDGDQLATLFRGLQQNALVDAIDHVLTGYIGTASVVTTLATTVLPQLLDRKRVRYVCDPVLGDKGVLYVPPALVDLYREQMLPLADVITPNQYEAELLTKKRSSIQSMDDVVELCQALHDLGPALVLLTSVELPDRPGELTVVASSKQKDVGTRTHAMWTVTCPLLPDHFTGTGDVCAALFLAHTAAPDHSLSTALERVVNTIFAILEDTQQRAGTTVQSRELCLVRGNAQRWIQHPPTRFRAERVQLEQDAATSGS